MAMRLSEVSAAVLETRYAVRGPIVARAQALERAGKRIIYCNIGNPQALGQKPLTWIRQGLALGEYPVLADLPGGSFPEDAIENSRRFLEGSGHGLGAYSESKGVRIVRDTVAEFIDRRDGGDGSAAVPVKADPDSIFLTDGASKAVQTALRMLIASAHDGIMIPIPQYPLYSASIALYGGKQVGYYLDEAEGWALSESMLEDAFVAARAEGTKVKAICVINPGNPTGAVLDRDNIAMVIRFASRHGLAILADEVYQDNIYRPGLRFVSFARVMAELGETDVSLFSFHSCSKGILGECGQRGGYMEIRNIPVDVAAQITKLQSVSLCANLPGQLALYFMVKPPRPGDPSRNLYDHERSAIMDTLKARAILLAEGLSAIPGYSCAPISGAMYAFPRIDIPAGKTDEDYCLDLLETTGICVVPGSGFGQKPGTAHFRTTILPPVADLESVVRAIAAFHATWR
ncbi:MAG: aminotransferase class I/II-fold pyridoxal phosphate-dependent enzyme [Rectinemataceae bacterium]